MLWELWNTGRGQSQAERLRCQLAFLRIRSTTWAMLQSTGRREQEATAGKITTVQKTAWTRSDPGAVQLTGLQASKHRITEVLGEQFASRKECAWRLLRTGMRTSHDKHGLFFFNRLPQRPFPFLKSQRHLWVSNTKLVCCWPCCCLLFNYPRNVTPEKSFLKTSLFTSELFPL